MRTVFTVAGTVFGTGEVGPQDKLETTIAALEKERADLVITLEAQTPTDTQILTIEDFQDNCGRVGKSRRGL